jgi:hypothetical protein
MPLSTWFYMPFQLHRRVGPNIQIYHKIIMKADCMSFCLPPYCSSLDIDRRHIQNLQRRMCSQQVSLDAPRLPDREQQRLAAEVQGSCSWSSVEFSGRGFSSEEETVYIYTVRDINIYIFYMMLNAAPPHLCWDMFSCEVPFHIISACEIMS